MTSTFEISHALGTHACVVHLSGDIDTAVVPELRQALDASFESGCAELILDMTEVTYIDSSALGLLVWLDHKLVPNNGRVTLAGANADVSRILELSGLSRLAMSIKLTGDFETALAELEPEPQSADTLWTRQIRIASDVNELAAVRDEVSELLPPLGFSESAVFDVKVALGEALANAVRHGSPPADGRICVDVSAFEDRVMLEISDNGPGFDGVHTASDDLYAPSGRGILFMRALMDRVEFDTALDGGTLVRLVKHHRIGSA